MSNQWLRLWHEMPADPKWRTIARASKQRIGDVMAVYLHLLVAGSTAPERGRTHSFNCEDVASALDLDTADVASIIEAMQTRVLDGDRLKGWDKRQPTREDGSAERARAWREDQKAKKAAEGQGKNADERGRTQPERDRTQDKEEKRENKKDSSSLRSEESAPPSRKRAPSPPALPEVPVDELVAAGFDAQAAADFIAHKAKAKAPLTRRAWLDHQREAAKAGWSVQQAAEKVMARHWKGFEEKYVRDERPPARHGPAESFRERDERLAAERIAEATGGLLRSRPRQPESFRERDQRLAAERVAEFAPSLARRPKEAPRAPTFDFEVEAKEVIDVVPRRLA